MAINVTRESSRKRLWDAMGKSWKDLEPYRRKRRELIEVYCGSGWGGVEDSKKAKTIENLLALTAQAYVVSLAAQNPRVTVSTFNPDLKAFSHKFGATVNALLQEISFDVSMRQLVLDAFFSVGVAKIYRANAKPIEILNPDFPDEPGFFSPEEEWEAYRRHQQAMSQTIQVDPGQPYFERISLDDFGCDLSARKWDGIRYAWHEYLIPRDDLLNDSRVDPDVIDELHSTTRWDQSLFEPTPDRTADLGSSSHDQEDIEDMVRVADVWLPRENKFGMMVTGGKWLFVEDWDGPERGPFRLLCFDDVPDNVMPKAPGQDLMPMHDMLNSLMRKSARQANSQKNIKVYQNDQDARAIEKAKDGDTIKTNNPDAVKFLNTPGPDQGNLAFAQIVDGKFDRQAGNLSGMAGLGPQSKTASQDQLIHESLSGIQDLRRGQIITFVTHAVTDLGQMLWVDQAKQIDTQLTLPGLTIPIPVKWTPEDREGDFFQYQFKIEPYSMVYKSPQQKVQEITGLMSQVVAPLMAQIQMAGGMLDVQELISILARLMDLPQLEDIVKFAVPLGGPMGGMGGGQQQSGMPAATTRTYERRNVSGGSTPDAQRTQMVQQLLNSRNQQGGENGWQSG